MKIKKIIDLNLNGPKLIVFEHFNDNRGYFTETYNPEIDKILDCKFYQMNESYSKPNVIKGLHFQYDPPMGKLVRTTLGEMYDIIVDIRKDSNTFRKGIVLKLDSIKDANQWIWVPPGFAHGNFFFKETKMEYLCSAVYNKDGEGCINPFSEGIDWSLCDKNNLKYYYKIKENHIISEKDKNAVSLNKQLCFIFSHITS